MRLTERDYQILETIWRYDGILSFDQVHRWFFGAKRRAYYRIQALCEHGFLERLPKKELYRVPEPIVWLNKQGAISLCDYLGLEYESFAWRSKPRWSKISHDLALNEFRHTIEAAFASHSGYELEVWHGQDELERLFPDPITYLDYGGEQVQRRIRPDGYFCLRVLTTPVYLLRFFVELDNNTQSSQRFGRDKVLPGVQFLHTSMYQEVLGGKTGRFLVVTVGPEARFHNLRSIVHKAGGAGYFLFTRSEEWQSPEEVLTTPLLYLAHDNRPVSFETYNSEGFQRNLVYSLTHEPQVKLLP